MKGEWHETHNRNGSRHLTDRDVAWLESSFVTQEIAKAAGLFRVSNSEGAEIVGRRRTAGTEYSGVVFPYFRPPEYAAPREYRLRRDTPDLELNEQGELKESGKYLSPPGTRNMLYFPPGVTAELLKDKNVSVVITEGEKKALALVRLAMVNAAEPRWPFLPIALPGVWSFRGSIGKTTSSNGERVTVKGSIPDLDLLAWNNREVVILFDANVRTNSSVAAARSRLAKVLREKGAKPLYAELPEDCGVNGVDDLLARVEKESGLDAAIRVGREIIASARKPSRTKNPLPTNFQVVPVGSNPGIYFQDEDGERTFICSPLEVVAETHTENGENYGRLLRWTDSKNREKKWAMPIELIHGEGVELIRYLSSLGLRIAPTRKHYERLRAYINLSEPEQTIICTNRIGWHERSFVLPDESFGGDHEIVFQTESLVFHKFNQKGTLKGWQENVASYCAGNTRLVFAVSAAFGGPLLPILDVPGGGFHFRGSTSTGKTTALLAAGSVLGGSNDLSGYCQTWRATANGLESVCESHNHALLCLDEIGECDPRQVGDVAYMIANGQGKSRMARSITARKPITWQLLFLSSGEQRLSDKMSEAGQTIKGGQEIRLCDIEADTGHHGLFAELHGLSSGQALADHLRTASKAWYGTAIREYLRLLVELDRGGLAETWSKFASDFRSRVLKGLNDPPSEIVRVATRFAVVAYAGELATGFGITGWEKGEATDAAAEIFKVWHQGREGSGTTDSENAIRQVRAFLEAHGQSRFETLDRGEMGSEKVVNRAGYKRVDRVTEETEFLIFPESFKREVCKGLNSTFVAKEIKRRGLLKTDSGSNQKTERLPEYGLRKVYVVLSKIFEGGEEQTEPDDFFP